MGFFDALSDLVAAAAPWGTAEAEAPAENEQPEEKEEETKEEEQPEAEEEEEEEEEEMVDPKERLEEECKESKQCAPMKHHFDECVERVTGADDSEKKGPHEDCVEEFFHLAHCASACAAPKLWRELK